MMKNLPYKKRFIITQTFMNPNNCYSSGYHLGVDLVGLEDKKIYAIEDGIVTYAGYNTGFGNTVVVRQIDGLYARYSHLESISVKNNQNVTGGQTVIGIEGKSGRVYGGLDPRHLDLRISRVPYHTDDKTAYVDPCEYLGFPNKRNNIITPGGINMTKLKNIVISESEVDKRAAGYLADHLNCNIIDYDLLPPEVIDQVFENVYVIGTPKKPVSKAVNIYGDNRYDTCRKVLDIIQADRGKSSSAKGKFTIFKEWKKIWKN